jgi:hypothetical protein
MLQMHTIGGVYIIYDAVAPESPAIFDMAGDRNFSLRGTTGHNRPAAAASLPSNVMIHTLSAIFLFFHGDEMNRQTGSTFGFMLQKHTQKYKTETLQNQTVGNAAFFRSSLRRLFFCSFFLLLFYLCLRTGG